MANPNRKPVHINDPAKLAAALARQQAKVSAQDQLQAAKAARQHQRLNALAERVNETK